MANSGQDAAVRVALAEASRIEGLTPGDFRVISVRIARRQNTTIRYYDIVLEMATGTVRRSQVSVDPSWVRPTWVAQ